MPTLTFRLKKRADANAQLILVREDGTSSVGQVGPANAYGPVHDLTHYAIEQTLGLSEGFLGLVASGWEISDFEVKGTAQRLPLEAIFAESAAGDLSRLLMMGQVTTAEDLLWGVNLYLDNNKFVGDRPTMTEKQFDAIVAQIQSEWAKWRALEPNGTLELTYTAARRSTVAAPTADERKSRKLAAR